MSTAPIYEACRYRRTGLWRFRSLVASPRVQDLLICAKHLFFAAMSCRCALDGLGSEQTGSGPYASRPVLRTQAPDPSGRRQAPLKGSANAACGPAPNLAGFDRDRPGRPAAAAQGRKLPGRLFTVRRFLCADATRRSGRDPEGLRPMPKRMDAERCLLRGDASTALGAYP
jgi:hypothetical protein